MKFVVLVLALFSASSFALKEHEFDVQHNGFYAYHPASPGITVARASWVVPNDPPTRNDQKLAYWIGLQSEDSKMVLQPVLTWGAWANGATKGWNLSCWAAFIAKNGEVSHKASKYVPVYPGEKLNAIVEFVSYRNGLYSYRCGFEGYPDTFYTYESKEFLNTVMLELEVQDMTSCNDFADNAEFTNVYLGAGNKNISGTFKKLPTEDKKRCGIKARSKGRGAFSIGVK